MRAPLAQSRYHLIGISSRNKLTSRFGNVPTQDRSAYPWKEARQTNPGADERVETIIRIAEILFEVLDDLTGSPQGGQDGDKAKKLGFEPLVAHRERHQALIEPGLAEKR
ncbi:MAG: hypothetical protein DMF02_02950, partial [Verrucomicrobia bacterium]